MFSALSRTRLHQSTTGLIQICGRGSARAITTQSASKPDEQIEVDASSEGTIDVASTSAPFDDDESSSAGSGISREQPFSHLFQPTERFREDFYVELNAPVVDERRRHRQALAADDAAASGTITAEQEQALKDWEDERSRDISGLHAHHRWQLRGLAPPMDRAAVQWEPTSLRQRYARYGRASGVNPGVMWMTSTELAEQKASELHLTPDYKFTERTARLERRKKERVRKEREAEIDKKMAEYPKVLAEWYEETRKEREEKEAAAADREARVQEIKEQYGYYIDVEDKKFKKLIEEKEKLAKRAEKAAKKQARVTIKV